MNGKHIIVIGAGISGLTAAWRLRVMGATVTVLERNLRVGGLIETERRDGFVFEHGADAFVADRQQMLEELDALDLRREVVAMPALRGPCVRGAHRFEELSGSEATCIGGTLGSTLFDARHDPGGLSTLRRGMESLTDRIVASLGSALKLGVTVHRIERTLQGVFVDAGRLGPLEADAVVAACPARVAAHLLTDLDPDLAALLASIRFGRVDTLNLAYRRRDVPAFTLRAGTGFVVDETQSDLIGCTWAHPNWPTRAPDELVLLRCLADAGDVGDDELLLRVRGPLSDLLGIDASPARVRIRRHPRALPTFDRDHTECVAKIRSHVDAIGRVQLAGNAYDGASVPDCIASGRRAAQALAA